MEGSIVAVEENHQRADSTNGAPNSLGSLVKIDSISIDLGITMARKNDTGDKCRHFTIRGYVAEMREKDSKLCDPFSLFRKDSNPEEQLSPLAATKCRRWECKKCLRDVNTASASEKIGGAISKCCEKEIISGSSHVPSCHDGAVDKSHLSESQALEIYERRETDLNTSANSDGHEINFLSNKKGKNAEVGDLTAKGHYYALENNSTQEVANRACELQVLNQCVVSEAHTESSAPDQPKISTLFGSSSQPRCEIQDAAAVLLAIEYPTCGFAEKGQQINSSDEKNRDLSINHNMPEESGKLNEEAKADKGKRIRLPSFDSEEFETASDDPSHHRESLTGVSKKRPQKVRLLAELLGSKDNPENNKRKTGASFPNETPNLSNELGLVSANPTELSHDGAMGNASLGPERKRKLEEEKPTTDHIWLKNMGKKARTLKGDEEHKKVAIEISDSETEDAASLGVKSKLKKHGSDRNPILGPKKNKQVQFIDGYLPIGSWGDVNPKANLIKMKDAERTCIATVADACYLKSASDPLKNRGMESHYKNYIPQQHTGKESSSSSKKKSKMPQVEERQAFFMPPSRNTDVRFLQNGSEIAKSTMGLDLSLSGFMNAERNEKNRVAQAADKSGFLLPRPKAIPSKEIRRKDGIFIGESSVSRKSIPDPFMRERLNYDFNQKIAHGAALSREQQNCSPRFEDGSFSMRHNLDLSGPSNSKRATEGHCRLEPVRRHSEQRNSEEIPMEIVELMAKNQYERSLCEAEKNNYRRNNNNKRANPEMLMGFPSKVHGNNGVMRILPKEYPSMRKPPPTNGILPSGEHVGPSKSNHISFFAPDQRSCFNMGPQEENPGLKMFDAFSPSIRFQNSFQNNDKPEQFWSFRPPQVSEDRQIPEKNKGKVVREFDLNRVAPNNTSASEPFNGMSTAYHAPAREQRGTPDRNPKVMTSSFDSFSQDAIPAMQLLSLMDAGLNTSKPFDVYPKRVLEKPFYPCGNHPNFSMEKPLFQSNYSNSKSPFSGVGSGVVYKPVESSRHTSSSSLNNYGKNQNLEKSCVCAADPYVPLFQTDRNSKRPVSTDNRIFFKPREQDKERRSSQNPQKKPRKSHKHGAALPLPTVLEFKSVQDKQKGVAGSSSKRVDLEGSYWNGTVGPANVTSSNEFCMLNRNPADFSVPEKDNMYTINGEDLRFPKKNSPKAKSKILRQ